MNGLIGTKLGMTQVFDEASGKQIPVTALALGPCTVVQIKQADREGYDAVQVGFSDKRERSVNKPEAGHFKKAGVAPKRFLHEFRKGAEDEALKVGDALVAAEVFEGVERVDVVGTTKGRGFQGVMKRHNMSGGRASHGSGFHRRPGSIGMCKQPSRVFKGKKMPGQYGNVRVTTQNLLVVNILPEDHIMLVRGAVPGPNGSTVIVRKSLKKAAKVS